MTNWRRAEVVGRCNQTDVPSLELAIKPGPNLANVHPLTARDDPEGLPMWAREQIHAAGQLGAEGYAVEDVEAIVRELCRRCPSLSLAVHVGAADGSDKCEATVVGTGRPNGQEPNIKVLPPQVFLLVSAEGAALTLEISNG